MIHDAENRRQMVATPARWAVGRTILTILFLVFAAWIISPMFTSSYVEAYVARLQSMAILNHQGQIGLDDQAYPITSEFLYVTRIGMVWLLQGSMIIVHSTELWVLRVVTILSFVLLAASSVFFVRRWTAVSPWVVLACVILTPGILEPSFFFADNLVAASLTSFALALTGGKPSLGRWFGIGAVVACAMLVRLDAVLIVPAILAVSWLTEAAYRRMALMGLAALFGASVTFAISDEVTGVSLIQAYQVGHLFSSVNNNPMIYQTGLAKTRELIFFGFFGLVTLPLLGLGMWENFKTHLKAWNVVMILLPIIFYMMVIPHANEIRDFCIMGSPFVLLHAACGLRRLLGMASEPWGISKWSALALFAIFIVVFIAPPYISMRDGPRALTGRIYAPIFWRQWQGRTLGMIGQLHDLVDAVTPGERILIISSQFEPDRYLHLRLLQEGFRILPVAGPNTHCQSIETAERDGRTVVSIRTENPYGMIPGAVTSTYLANLQLVMSLQCLSGEQFDRRYFFSIGKSGDLFSPDLSGREVGIPEHFPLRILHTATYGFFGDRTLSREALVHLDAAAQGSVAQLSQSDSGSLPTYEDFRSRVGHRYWFPK